MTNTEMLLKLLAQSGWTVTGQTDEDGSVICTASDDEKGGE